MATVSKRRGRYVLDYYDQHGERHRETLKAGTTLKQAKDALRDIEEKVSRGTYIPAEKILKFSEAAEEWLEYKKPNLRQSTWSVYEGHTRIHFPEFADMRVDRITTAKVEKWIRKRREEGMLLASIRKILVSLNQILAYCVRHGYIDYNPVRDAERPRANGDEKALKIRVLGPKEIGNFLDHVTDPKYHLLFKLAITTGARQGELLGLKWSDIDWHTNQIFIQRSYNKQRFYRPKSKASERKMDIGPEMMRDLKRWRLACLPNDLDLVFPNEAGQPLNYSNMVNRHFVPALEAAEIGKIRFHDLRHTNASLRIREGQNVVYIANQLGHSTPTVTLNIYSHLFDTVNQPAAAQLEGAIFGTGHKPVTKTSQGATADSVTP